MSFIDPGTQPQPVLPTIVTPQTVDRKRQLALALLNSGEDASPIRSPWQGAARVAQALIGGLQYRQANQQEQQGLQGASSGVQKLVSALNPVPAPVSMPSTIGDGTGFANPTPPATDSIAPAQPAPPPISPSAPPPQQTASGPMPPAPTGPSMGAPANVPSPPSAPSTPPPIAGVPVSAPAVNTPAASSLGLGDILQIAQNPWLSQGQSAIASSLLENKLRAETPEYSFSTLPDGTVVRENPRTGTAEPLLNAVKPQFTRIGSDQFGNPTFGWVNSQTGAVTPANGAGTASAPGGVASPDAAALHGDDFLKTLPAATADQIKAYASGRMAIPSGFALKTPYFQKLMQDITQYDPSFDAVNYNARAKTRADFTSGKSAQSINALNTVIGHLQSLKNAGDALPNGNWQFVNSLRNAYNTATGDPSVVKFNTTKKAVVDELTRVWRGSGGSEGDIKTWSDQINDANSPAQLHSVIGQIGDLLESKLNALGETYTQGMGTTADPIQLITPSSQTTLDALRGEPPGAAVDGATPNTAAPPVVLPTDQAAAEAAYAKLPSGTQFVTPDGKVRTKSAPAVAPTSP